MGRWSRQPRPPRDSGPGRSPHGDLLATGLALAHEEATTPIWFALRLSPTTFAVFDAFHEEAGRQAHLAGPIAKALIAKTPELFGGPPSIEPIEVLGLKNSGAV